MALCPSLKAVAGALVCPDLAESGERGDMQRYKCGHSSHAPDTEIWPNGSPSPVAHSQGPGAAGLPSQPCHQL